MQRRSFVKSSILGGLLPTTLLNTTGAQAADSTAAEANRESKTNQEYYELRVYHLKDATQQQLVDGYLQNALIPAYNKLGSKNVGVFTELKAEGQTKVYLLTSFRSLDEYAKVTHQVESDSNYKNIAEPYLTAPASAPAYERIESSLFLAFEGLPVLEKPAGESRIFELRRYESPNESAGQKKIEMFNKAGEIPLFRRVGLKPVFFGECLIGQLRPNLTYLLVFKDMAEHDAAWKAFGNDAEWKKLKSMPEYADSKIISKITSIFLTPTSYSQV